MCARPEFQYSFTAAFMSYTFCIFIICNQDFKAAVKPLSSPLWCLSIHLRRHQSPFVINAAQWRQHTEVIHWRSSSWVISDFNKHLGETSYHTIFKAQQLSHLNNLFDSTACGGGDSSLTASKYLAEFLQQHERLLWTAGRLPFTLRSLKKQNPVWPHGKLIKVYKCALAWVKATVLENTSSATVLASHKGQVWNLHQLKSVESSASGTSRCTIWIHFSVQIQFH